MGNKISFKEKKEMGKKKSQKEKLLRKGKGSSDSDSDESSSSDSSTHSDYEVNEDVKIGPMKERKSTDILCCLIFLVTLVMCLVLSIKGYWVGNFDELIAPIDSDGNLCGEDPGYEDYPYLYIFDIDSAINTGNIFSYGVCVNECPDSSNSAN